MEADKKREIEEEKIRQLQVIREQQKQKKAAEEAAKLQAKNNQMLN